MKRAVSETVLLLCAALVVIAGRSLAPGELQLFWPRMAVKDTSATLPNGDFRKPAGESLAAGMGDMTRNWPESPLQLSRPVSRGASFIAEPFSAEQGIDKLTRAVAEDRLDRRLFGLTGQTASWFHIRYFNQAPFVSSTYLQFVTDPLWNRMIYGKMDAWIKSYDNLNQPSAIEVDPLGRIYIVEENESQITVLKIVSNNEEVVLKDLYRISEIMNPSDISYHDGGTPFDGSDDHFYAASGSKNRVYRLVPSDEGATVVDEYDGFDTPRRVITGKWKGTNNDRLYVIDQLGKRLRTFREDDRLLTTLGSYTGTHQQYFSDLAADHFGNIYMADRVNDSLYKFTADLELLDVYGGKKVFTALQALEVPFGRIDIEGVAPVWTGFDQVFTLEEWSGTSGAQRKSLGVGIRDFELRADEDVSYVDMSFLVTDFSRVSVDIYNQYEVPVYHVRDYPAASGQTRLIWQRSDFEKSYVLPGNYRFELSAASLYRDEQTTATTEIYLPLYFRQGGPGENDFLIRGIPVNRGNLHTVEDADRVIYKFPGFEADRTYYLNITCAAGDGLRRRQNVTVNGVDFIPAFEVDDSQWESGYTELPAGTGGELAVSVNRLGEGTAVVSQIRIKENTENFLPSADAEQTPEQYILHQNYPNPFNPATTIRFELPEAQQVELFIYNILGQKVQTLINGEHLPAGYHTRIFEGRSLASGLYIYRLRAGGFQATKKMLLLR